MACVSFITVTLQPSCLVHSFTPVAPVTVFVSEYYSINRRYNFNPSLYALKDSQLEEYFDPLQFYPEVSVFSNSHEREKKGTIEAKQQEGNLSVWAARCLLLFVAILWGTNFGAVKYLENLCFDPPCNHPPSEAAFARFAIAAISSILFLVNRRIKVILAGLECGLWVTLGYFTQAAALSSISSAKCAFICSLTVVFVPLIEAIFFGKPMKPINILSGALAILGVGVLEGMVNFNDVLGFQTDADMTNTVSNRYP